MEFDWSMDEEDNIIDELVDELAEGTEDDFLCLSEEKLTLRELLSDTLHSGELAESMFIKQSAENQDILKLAGVIDRYFRDTEEHHEKLIAVYWMHSVICGPSFHVRIEPRVDFVEKRELFENFHYIPEYDNLLLRDIDDINKIGDVEIVASILAGARSIRAIDFSTIPLAAALSAEVSGFFECNGGFMVKTFLRQQLDMYGRKAKTSHFRNASLNKKLDVDEMRAAIRQVYLFNKISFYRIIRDIFETL